MAKEDYVGKMCPQQFCDPNFSVQEVAFCFEEKCAAWYEELGGCVLVESAKAVCKDALSKSKNAVSLSKK